LESVAATDFNFGVMILTSFCYTRKEFCATPAHFQFGRGEWVSRSSSKIAVLCLTLAVHHSVQEAYSSWICEVESLNCLQTKWEAWDSCGLGMVIALK